MNQFKCIATICWKFDSEKTPEECLQQAKDQLASILNCHPGSNFESFNVHVDLVKLKPRMKLTHIATYDVDSVLQHVTDEPSRKEWVVDGKSYMVKMNSDRYHLFKRSRVCVSCGLIGTQMVLDFNGSDLVPHFNLYAEEANTLVLMTKDHILAKSKGGLDCQSNYMTMCSTCNNLKSSYDLSPDQVRRLRHVADNHEMLPRQELRDLITKMREEMINTSVAC